MTCHPTDIDNLMPENQRPVPERTEKRECAGALLLIQRELKLLEKDPGGYFKNRRGGLTKPGVAWWALNRCTFGGTPFGGPKMFVIAEDEDIGLPDVNPVPAQKC